MEGKVLNNSPPPTDLSSVLAAKAVICYIAARAYPMNDRCADEAAIRRSRMNGRFVAAASKC